LPYIYILMQIYIKIESSAIFSNNVANVRGYAQLPLPALSAARQAGLGYAVAGRSSERFGVGLPTRKVNEPTTATHRPGNRPQAAHEALPNNCV
jgi:hypothetical protein